MYPKYEYRSNRITVGLARSVVEEFPVRFHKELEMICVLCGEVRAEIDGKSLTLREKHVYVAFPNVLHSLHRSDATAVIVLVDCSLFPQYTDLLFGSKPEMPVMGPDVLPEIVFRIFERLVQLKAQQQLQQPVAMGYLGALLGEILPKLSCVQRSVEPDLAQQLVMHVVQNYTGSISLEKMAAELGYSRYHLSHVIADTFGCNFRTLLNSYRISMAQNLLLSTDQTVSQIAEACGFQNQSSFNRIFRNCCHMTPSHFRDHYAMSPEIRIQYNG